jgi:hypothetical protein
LIDAVAERFPESPPYEGAHSTVIPHVTVREGRLSMVLWPWISRRLPIESRADEVWLMQADAAGRWSRLAAFPLRRTR